ncbi:MAG: hypothetical protein Q8S13_00910 [Dehalococcoidia bacterium]|nr:hypothetical protein [Dehalococcoidia bacterium]
MSTRSQRRAIRIAAKRARRAIMEEVLRQDGPQRIRAVPVPGKPGVLFLPSCGREIALAGVDFDHLSSTLVLP